MLTPEIHQLAVRNAQIATNDYIQKNGEHPFNCGFSWVTVFVKGNTKLGKSFIAKALRKVTTVDTSCGTHRVITLRTWVQRWQALMHTLKL